MSASPKVSTRRSACTYARRPTKADRDRIGRFGGERAFEAHVREQLPWYELASDAAALVAKHDIPKGGLVYDIGCSTGKVGRSLAGVLEERQARLIALDECADVVRAYQAPGTAICADAATFD
ncbi:hypothetical protein [Stappia sp.]|uniref:hypothetical protein n=1 Tax=Stappia sp. TaxID=1870903 RepID=UPI003C7E070B